MYTQINSNRYIRKRVKRRSYVWKFIVKVVLLAAAIYTAVLLGGTLLQNRNLSKYIEAKGDYENIDISKGVTRGEIPLFLQTDRRWAGAVYGDDIMAETGCGPTCLSMVYCGLTGDDEWNPYKLACKAEMEGYYVRGSGSAWSMMTELANEIGLEAYEVSYDAESIRRELESGHPIICIMGPGDFTTTGHFIVLSEIKEDGSVVVKDPNSKENSKKTWEIEELMRQMKNLWGYQMP